jgi:hypothetical protein
MAYSVLADEAMMPVQSEILCFVAEKCKTMAFDHIVKLVSDFYNDDEISQAKKLVSEHCDASHRLPKRTGNGRKIKTVEDIVKTLLNPEVKLPVFFAVNLTRLPPVDATHCDVAAILAEVSMLRQEVRAVAQLREEIAQLRAMLNVSPICMTNDLGDVPTTSLSTNVDSIKPTFADKAKTLHESGAVFTNKHKKPTVRPTVGSSNLNSKVKAVKTYRAVDLFITRLHPETTKAELIDCIQSVCEESESTQQLNIVSTECTKLKSRFEGLYCSYRLQIRIDGMDMQRALDLFMSPSTWPSGILVRRYFPPKNGNAQSPSS